MRTIRHDGKPFDHGAGWFRRPTMPAGDWMEHFGAGAGFWNVMRLYPPRGLAVAIMTNSTRAHDFKTLFTLLGRTSWS
jgi:CubicO group peptidase (beta-lactamase class C family)